MTSPIKKPDRRCVVPVVIREKAYIKCTNCHEILISLHRHDFRSCNCPEDKGCYIDGGDVYTRIGGNPESGVAKFEINYNKGTFKKVR